MKTPIKIAATAPGERRLSRVLPHNRRRFETAEGRNYSDIVLTVARWHCAREQRQLNFLLASTNASISSHVLAYSGPYSVVVASVSLLRFSVYQSPKQYKKSL